MISLVLTFVVLSDFCIYIEGFDLWLPCSSYMLTITNPTYFKLIVIQVQAYSKSFTFSTPLFKFCVFNAIFYTIILSYNCLLHLQLEKAMAPHSSTLAWKIPWTEEPGRLQSMGSLRVGHD